jgi:hypothetical protein
MHLEVLPKATAAAQGSSWQTCILSNVAIFDAPNKVRAFIGKNLLLKVNTSKRKLLSMSCLSYHRYPLLTMILN